MASMPLRAFFRVTLPLVFPGMISVAMLWIFAWNEYLFANLLTGTTVKTFPVHIPTFTLGSQSLWNLIMAFSLVAMPAAGDPVRHPAPLHGARPVARR